MTGDSGDSGAAVAAAVAATAGDSGGAVAAVARQRATAGYSGRQQCCCAPPSPIFLQKSRCCRPLSRDSGGQRCCCPGGSPCFARCRQYAGSAQRATAVRLSSAVAVNRETFAETSSLAILKISVEVSAHAQRATGQWATAGDSGGEISEISGHRCPLPPVARWATPVAYWRARARAALLVGCAEICEIAEQRKMMD